MHHAPAHGRPIRRIIPLLSTERRIMNAFRMLCALAPVAAAAGGAHAEAQNTASLPSDGGSGWRVECANDGKQLDCRAVNRVHQRDTQQLIVAVAIRIPPDTKKPTLAIQLPLGIQVAENVTVRIDEGQTE